MKGLGIMKKFLFFILFISNQSIAGFTADLTHPEYQKLASLYPSYELLRSLNFDETGEYQSIVGFKHKKENKNWDAVYSAKIGNSVNGTQNIYIEMAQQCTEENKKIGMITINTNGQNVRYNKFCNGKEVYIIPLSKAGNRYLVRQFKNDKLVKFKFPNINITFDAQGFSNAWDSFGGDAI